MTHTRMTAAAIVVALIAIVGRAAGAEPDRSAAEPRPATAAVQADAAATIAAAREALEAKRYDEAILFVDRVLHQTPDNSQALSLLLHGIHHQVRKEQAAGKHRAAILLLEIGKQHYQNFYQLGRQGGPGAPAPQAILRAKQVIENIEMEIQQKLTAQAKKYLNEAQQAAHESYRWYWWSDRDHVRRGLRELRWVHDHLELLDADTRGAFFHVLGLLKARVANSEWDALLAEAGYAQ